MADATRGVLQKNLFVKASQYSQEKLLLESLLNKGLQPY